MFRVGQWVKLTQDVTFGTIVEKKGTVGIHVEQAKGGMTAVQGVPLVGLANVHLVAYPSGLTRKEVILPYDFLEPVIDRNDLPANRLATCDPEWQPVP